MATETSTPDYAFWTAGETNFTVVYSLGIFHEIDFAVNEGYRRIPYGGVEVGGLLFGHISEDRVTIDAFRSIECEHAAGPSFVLSSNDTAKLREQIAGIDADPDLAGLEVVGWFIAHTRGSLKLTEKELALFNEFFPGPGKLTVLVKPERFQPTRFGFLVRNEKEHMPTDASQSAIILPLPGRAKANGGPVPSIPAPRDQAASVPVPTSTALSSPVPASTTPSSSIPPAPDRTTVVSPATADTAVQKPTEDTAQAAPPQKPKDAVPLGDKRPEAKPPAPVPFIRETRILESRAASAGPPLPRTAAPPGLSRPVEPLPAVPTRDSPTRRRAARSEEARPSRIQFALVLLMAALLGCCVGYWAYLQLPSAIIPLTVRAQPGTLVVSWPANETRGLGYAAIRIDDAKPVPLSPAEKYAGETAVPAKSDNIKVELIAHHWMRDSRGIVRFIRGPVTATESAPPGQASSTLP
ncbi:MAG: hypothetical protein JO033_13345 [Acidobacteriaceae bacterium]|nr:hypothetical protein [Acidobacteriaceae bacterium]MBV9500269.1 hypothetical protein [Acidobacteriaceae bacterium]